MDPRVQRSRATILNAARELVVERGIERTSVEDICQRSGVARTTVYRHWDSKPDVVLEALSDALQPPVDPDTGSVVTDLLELVGGFAAALEAGPLAGLLTAMMEAAQRDAAFGALHAREVEARHGVVRGVVDRGIARGELASSTDPVRAVADLLGPVLYLALVARRPVSDAWLHDIVDQFVTAARPTTNS